MNLTQSLPGAATLVRQVFSDNRELCVGDREARADRQRGKLIDGVAAGAPVGELLFVEARFVFGGMKVGVTMAMIGVIVGEFITAQAGLGYIIMFASSAGETATVLAAIVLLCGIGLALYGIVALGELALLRWYGGEMPVGGVI